MSDWHLLEIERIYKELKTQKGGLSPQEARQRLLTYGPNSIRIETAADPIRIFLHQFSSPLIYVLLIAMLVTLLIGEFADSIAIAAVLGLNASIGFFQEYRAENAMQALMGLVSPRATVFRDGKRIEISSTELVPGDIVFLESGNLVPADLRVIETSQLLVDESILTGESISVEKLPGMLSDPQAALADRKNLLFMGSSVASGRAKGVVIATGSKTEIGQIASQMRDTTRAKTPLQERMERFGKVISIGILTVCTIAFLIGLLQGLPAGDMFLIAVAISVAAIPEGLPIVMTVALAVCVRRMAKRNAIIRRLPAVETLGSCSVILSDKTGTLTENRMTVESIFTDKAFYRVSGTGLNKEGEFSLDGKPVDILPGSPLYETLVAGLLANESDLRLNEGKLMARGDPTEIALLVAAAKANLYRESLLESNPQTGLVPFESERQFSGSIHKNEQHDGLVLVKGAPERIIEMCDRDHRDETLKTEEALSAAQQMAAQGLRVLAMAKSFEKDAVESVYSKNPRGFQFLGLVGMMDPPRPEVLAAIAGCHRAGIRVLMCTGDHLVTASAIAKKIGLIPEHATGKIKQVISGRELQDIEDEDLDLILDQVFVYARVSPDQKLRIVNRLRASGEVVAVTGDGVNDAPALKSAHIGCAMGINGTDVAKEASEMVLADDNFASIYAAVQEGRTAFSNIRKATDFLISTSVGVVLALFGVFILASFGVFSRFDQITQIPLLLLPAQILWLNVVTNGIQDVALAFEPGEKHQFTQPPRDPKESLMSRVLIERSTLVGILMAAVGLSVFLWELNRGSTLGYAQATTLTAMVMFKMLHVGACRSESLSIFQKSMFSNPTLFFGTGISLVVHIGAMHFSPTQALLGLEPLGIQSWISILIVAPSVLLLVELHKLIRR